METMSLIVLACLVVYAVTAYIDKKKSDTQAAQLHEALKVISTFAQAVEHASSDHPMIIASSKSAKDLAQKLTMAYGLTETKETKNVESEERKG